MKEKAKIIIELEKDLMQYDSVLLCIPNDVDSVLERLFDLSIFKQSEANFKVYIPSSFDMYVKENVRVVSGQEMNIILEYYRMYEFTDRLKILGENKQFGGLVNYLKNGILTEEEVFEAILS